MEVLQDQRRRENVPHGNPIEPWRPFDFNRASLAVQPRPHFTPTPSSPPPPYSFVDNRYVAAAPPAPQLYQQAYHSMQHLPPVTAGPETINQPSPWASAPSLPVHYGHAAPMPIQSGPTLRNDHAEPNDCPIARCMNQGAALCDRIASTLSDALCRVDPEEARHEDVQLLTQALRLEDTDLDATPRTTRPTQRNRKPQIHPKPSIINFQKAWMYSNSRLPPQMLPLKVYMPTWQILCRAADASAAVYTRGNAMEDYIEADWRRGTKAMALTTVCLDEKNLIVFAIRGSKWNLVDWAVNFRPAPKEPVGFLDDQGNACHAGFLHVARAMIAPVAARLRQLLECDPSRASSSLVITGHSAGGAVASLLYMHMLSTTVESDLNVLTGCFRRVHCVTFGAPPVTLLPLQKPNEEKWKKNVFLAFANEGDPVVRADKEYVYCLARLIAAPAPDVKTTSTAQVLRAKASRQRLKQDCAQRQKYPSPAPVWPVPEATLSNAGRLVVLRKKPAQKHRVEAVCVSDEQLRHVVFGDPAMHDMKLYKERIDELAIAAVTGRE